MERRRAYIKQQAAAQKKEGTSPSNLSIKRKPLDETDRLLKKPKVAVGSVGVTPEEGKLPPPPIQEKGKGLMTGQDPSPRNAPPSFVKTLTMPLSSFCLLSRVMTMRTWATIQPRPWGRWVSSI